MASDLSAGFRPDAPFDEATDARHLGSPLEEDTGASTDDCAPILAGEDTVTDDSAGGAVNEATFMANDPDNAEELCCDACAVAGGAATEPTLGTTMEDIGVHDPGLVVTFGVIGV